MVSTLIGRVSYTYVAKKMDFDLKNRVIMLAKPSIEDPLIWISSTSLLIFVIYFLG